MIETATDKKCRFMSASEAVKLIKSGDNVFIQGSCSIPEVLCDALAARAGELHDVMIFNAFAVAGRESPLCSPECRDTFHIDSFFVSNAVRSCVDRTWATTTPMFLGEIPALFRSGEIRLDVALINCSMPNDEGLVSFGVSADLTPSAVEMSRVIIAQINRSVPFSYGDAVLPLSCIDACVEVDDPLVEVPSVVPTEKEENIGRFIAEIIPDGATLQIGVGGIPNAVLHALHDHKNLGLHTEAMTDGVVDLIKKGIINNSQKKVAPGKSVACLALGSRALYDLMDYNTEMEFRDVAWTNDPFIISRNPKVVSINSCLEIDLTGQICADSIGPRIFSGVGGQHDFVYGSSRSEGGFSVLTMLATTSKGANKIKPLLTPGAGVVTTRFQTQWVVTEYGAVNLRGKNLVDRARLLISIAAPEFREELDRAAAERLGYAYRTWK